MLLIAMISLTMSRISSRADSTSSRACWAWSIASICALKFVILVSFYYSDRRASIETGTSAPATGLRFAAGVDTTAAANPSDGNGVRPLSMAIAGVADGADDFTIAAAGTVAGADKSPGCAGAPDSEAPLRLPNKTSHSQRGFSLLAS